MVNILLGIATKLITLISVVSMMLSSSLQPLDAANILLGKSNNETYASVVTDYIFNHNTGIFEKATEQRAKEIIYAVALQILSGDACETEVTDVLDALPTEDIAHESAEHKSSVCEKTLLALSKLTSDTELPKDVSEILNLYGSGINDLYIYLEDAGDGQYEFLGSYVDDSGNTQLVRSGACYDSKTGMVYGKTEKGIFDIGYDYDAKNYMVTNPRKAWMRHFGFNVIYDMGGDFFFMDTDTVRVKYEVDGKRYMIQLWKGNYTDYSNGAEIGVYYLKDGASFFYTCGDEYDMMPMSMKLWDGENLVFSKDTTETWWLSGYKVGPKIDKSNLSLTGIIQFPTEEKANAFASSANNEAKVEATANGTIVSFVFK